MSELPEPAQPVTYYCNKCGFFGQRGPMHSLCHYDAVKIGPWWSAAQLEAAVAAAVAAETERMRNLCAVDMANATLQVSEMVRAEERALYDQVCEQYDVAAAEVVRLQRELEQTRAEALLGMKAAVTQERERLCRVLTLANAALSMSNPCAAPDCKAEQQEWKDAAMREIDAAICSTAKEPRP